MFSLEKVGKPLRNIKKRIIILRRAQMSHTNLQTILKMIYLNLEWIPRETGKVNTLIK